MYSTVRKITRNIVLISLWVFCFSILGVILHKYPDIVGVLEFLSIFKICDLFPRHVSDKVYLSFFLLLALYPFACSIILIAITR